MAGRTGRRYSGLIVALYASSQAVLGALCLWTAWVERDAHAIARCALHVLGCLSLVLAGCYSTRGRRGGLCALGAALSYLVDGGVRFLAAATALASRLGVTKSATLPPNAVRAQLVLAVAAGALPLPTFNRPLRAVTQAHAVVTALARAVDAANLHTAPVAAELLSACCALFVAVACVLTCSNFLLGIDPAVTAAQRKLAETTRVHDSAIWRDETGLVRALVRLRSRDASATRARVQAALVSTVDELYVQVDGLSTISRAASPTSAVA